MEIKKLFYGQDVPVYSSNTEMSVWVNKEALLEEETLLEKIQRIDKNIEESLTALEAYRSTIEHPTSTYKGFTEAIGTPTLKVEGGQCTDDHFYDAIRHVMPRMSVGTVTLTNVTPTKVVYKGWDIDKLIDKLAEYPSLFSDLRVE